MQRLLTALAGLTFSFAAAAQAPAPAPNADQMALRQLKNDVTTAVTKRDFPAAERVLQQPFMATLVTQEAFTDMAGMKRYYEAVFTRTTPRLKDMSLAAEVDGPSQILTGTFAVNKGSTLERYELQDGRTFDMKGRWTAVSLKQPDGSWKLLAVHTGVNFLDNPVLDAIEKSVMWTGAAGLVGGLAVGLTIGWVAWRRRRG